MDTRIGIGFITNCVNSFVCLCHIISCQFIYLCVFVFVFIRAGVYEAHVKQRKKQREPNERFLGQSLLEHVHLPVQGIQGRMHKFRTRRTTFLCVGGGGGGTS